MNLHAHACWYTVSHVCLYICRRVDRFVFTAHAGVCVCWHLIGLKRSCRVASSELDAGRRDWTAISRSCIHSSVTFTERKNERWAFPIRAPFEVESPLHQREFNQVAIWRQEEQIKADERETQWSFLVPSKSIYGWVIEAREKERETNCLCHSCARRQPIGGDLYRREQQKNVRRVLTILLSRNRTEKAKGNRRWLFNYFLINPLIGHVVLYAWDQNEKQKARLYGHSA